MSATALGRRFCLSGLQDIHSFSRKMVASGGSVSSIENGLPCWPSLVDATVRVPTPLPPYCSSSVFRSVGRRRSPVRPAVSRREPGRQVRDADDEVAALIAPQPAEDTAVAIVPVNPLETAVVEIDLVQRRRRRYSWFRSRSSVWIPGVRRLEQVPVERLIVVPFRSWAISLPMNSSFLPGCANIAP